VGNLTQINPFAIKTMTQYYSSESPNIPSPWESDHSDRRYFWGWFLVRVPCWHGR